MICSHVGKYEGRHQKQVDELIKHDRRITQKQIAGRLGMSKERVGYIIGLLGYTKVCSRWVPRNALAQRLMLWRP